MNFEYEEDDLIPNLYKVNSQFKSSLLESEAVWNMDVIVQDKSSCLPVYFLSQYVDKAETLTCLDCTAAPGNKTI